MKLAHGQQLKWWMGIAWKDFQTLTWVVYPIPFNLIARWARDLWHIVAGPGSQPTERDFYMRGYEHGYTAGLKHHE